MQTTELRIAINNYLPIQNGLRKIYSKLQEKWLEAQGLDLDEKIFKDELNVINGLVLHFEKDCIKQKIPYFIERNITSCRYRKYDENEDALAKAKQRFTN